MATAVWKGHITFGLVSFPVKLFTAARGETVGFNQLHSTDHSRVKQVLYCAMEDKPIDHKRVQLPGIYIDRILAVGDVR